MAPLLSFEVDMSTPPADRLVVNARIGPDDTPHEAATHVWAQVVANHDVEPGDPLAQLGVFDRVVLVLRDVIGLSDATVAHVLNTSAEATRRAHGHARARFGLPQPASDECEGWAGVRADHRPGDPAVLAALLAHTATCVHCRGAVRDHQRAAAHDGQHRLHPWWARRTVAAATHRTAPASVPAVVGTLGAVAAVVTSAAVLGAGVAPLPEPSLPQPVVVDDDPGLPSDEEPLEGWPSPPAVPDVIDGAPVAGGSGAAEPTDGPTDLVDGLTGTIDDATGPLTEPLTDPVQDVVEGVTDTVDDAVDEVTDTVEDVIDEVTDTTDELVDEATDTLDALP